VLNKIELEMNEGMRFSKLISSNNAILRTLRINNCPLVNKAFKNILIALKDNTYLTFLILSGIKLTSKIILNQQIAMALSQNKT
jgi:hypothetical protein